MDFLLIVILGFVAAYLWRRTDALQAQIAYLEQSLDGMRHQLSRQLARQVQSAPAVNEEVADLTELVEDEPPLETPTTKIIPAARAEDIPATKSEPIAAEEAVQEPEYLEETDELAEPRFKFDFEDFFGRLLPIWAGGIALAVAGFFLVRYSIEQGLLGPEVRVALGFLFGAGLLGAAEIAYRQEHRIADPRVRQALAGAGLATLYASFYLAGTLYGLIGSAIAFLGMAGVTGSAILLSFRFGLPSAILGLVGGFAAPMMVASEEANVPVLALYLALVTGGLTYAGNKQGRSWLALAALAGGLGWGLLMLLSGLTGFSDILAFGGYIVVLGAVVPAFIRGGEESGLSKSVILRTVAAGLAAIQMAMMVAQADYTLLSWGLYGLLAASLAFFAWSESRLREANAFAAGIAVLLLGDWSNVTAQSFTIVVIAFTAIFAGLPLAHIWRGAHRKIDGFQIGGFAFGMMAVVPFQLWGALGDNGSALAILAMASLPAIATWRLWLTRDDQVSRDGLFTLAVAAIGAIVAGMFLTPEWASPLAFGVVALGLIALGWKRDDPGLTVLAWTASVLTVLILIPTGNFDSEVALLGGEQSVGYEWRGIVRWIAVLLPFAALAIRKPHSPLTHAAEIAASVLIYGVIAQIAPSASLAWIAAGLALLVAFVEKERLAARLTFAFITFAWAFEPLVIWLIGSGGALAGEPMLIAADLGWADIGLKLLPLLVTTASLVVKSSEVLREHLAGIAAPVGLIAAVIGHTIFKQLFGLESAEQFLALGMMERTIWQVLLLGAGIAVLKLASGKSWSKPVGASLLLGTLVHFMLFTFVLHNPLWSEQAVGAWPLANLLLPAHGVAIAAVLMLRNLTASITQLRPWLFDAAVMVLISMLALSELRHAFAGSLLTTGDVGQTEDLLRSLIGIVLAIGFLLWGARSQSRSCPIGSLVLMLGAVLKVFLLDASGLDGLVRVASFVALGFSLIGIGWFYTRQLAGAKASVTQTEA